MQNNVTELTQRLLRSLDSTYNVIDMPAVIEIVSLLEKVTITKELLETTRLGKYLNELRRKTNNDSLSKRAKELLKKWRNMVLPESNGQQQIKPATIPPTITNQTATENLVAVAASAAADESVDLLLNKRKRPNSLQQQQQQQQNQQDNYNVVKKMKQNGQLINSCSSTSSNNELELLSDNSNSSFKDVIKVKKDLMSNVNTTVAAATTAIGTVIPTSNKQQYQNQLQQQQHLQRLIGGDVIIINSDSNSSIPDINKNEPQLEQQLPKKRGRKKGSKNHKNLLDEAESSFSNKLAVSRGNSKVKTTQELIASLQNKNNCLLSNTTTNQQLLTTKSTTTKDDLSLRAAKLTERVSIIDQKLNTNANRYKNLQRNKSFLQKFKNSNNEKVNIIESGSVINDKSLIQQQQQQQDEEEIIVVDDNNEQQTTTINQRRKIEIKSEFNNSSDQEAGDEFNDEAYVGSTAAASSYNTNNNNNKIISLSVEEALAQLPPIDKSVLLSEIDAANDNEPKCSCCLNEINCCVDNKLLLGNDGNDNDEGLGIVQQQQIQQRFEFIEDRNCLAKAYYDKKYYLNCDQTTIEERVKQLHDHYISSVNGNYSVERRVATAVASTVLTSTTTATTSTAATTNTSIIIKSEVVDTADDNNTSNNIKLMKNDLYVNVVPNVNNECIPKNNFQSENFKKYSISECCAGSSNSVGGDNDVVVAAVVVDGDNNVEKRTSTDDDNNSEKIFREWHEVLDTPSYNGEILKILPYVIID